MKKKYIFVILAVIMLINIALSIYINVEKNSGTAICFANGGGCGYVQESAYSVVLGIPLTTLGIVFFAILAVSFLFRAFKFGKKKFRKFVIILSSMIVSGSILFALWLLHVQFNILGQICTYCLWIDSLTILSGIIFFVFVGKDTYALFKKKDV